MTFQVSNTSDVHFQLLSQNKMSLRLRNRPKALSIAFLLMSFSLTCFMPSSWHVLAFSSTPQSLSRNTYISSPTLTLLHSDIPKDRDQEKKDRSSIFSDLKAWMPPPPEDQFIMTGDISVLFLYAFTSHYLNNFVVESVIANSNSIKDALITLDPTGEVTSLQNPVWVSSDQPQLLETVLTINAEDNLLNHWGPLFSSAGSACVALCTCWLLAGWWHRAFLFQNSLECETTRALMKTFETWLSMTALMMSLVWSCHQLFGFMPFLHSFLGIAPSECLLTKADMMFLVDSATVLIAWRFMANSMMKYFR